MFSCPLFCLPVLFPHIIFSRLSGSLYPLLSPSFLYRYLIEVIPHLLSPPLPSPTFLHHITPHTSFIFHPSLSIFCFCFICSSRFSPVPRILTLRSLQLHPSPISYSPHPPLPHSLLSPSLSVTWGRQFCQESALFTASLHSCLHYRSAGLL